jgi:hypothetical protein
MKKLLNRSYARYKQKGYQYWYWALDVHDVIFKGDYKVDCELQWLPNAKRALKIIAQIPEIKIILYTSTRKDKTQAIIDKLKNEVGLEVYGVNENPDFQTDPGNLCEFDKKFCFDLMLDDKAGFDVYENAWEDVIAVLTTDLGLGLPKLLETVMINDSVKWVHLLKKRIQFGDKTYDYIYSHEAACGGHKVIVLPYRVNMEHRKEFMFIREHNILFGINYTVITGGVDAKTNDIKKIREQACLELTEESGIMSGVEFVTTLTGIKSSDNQYHVFKTNVGFNPTTGSSSGDGSVDELFTTKVWMTYSEALTKVKDGMALAALALVNHYNNS